MKSLTLFSIIILSIAISACEQLLDIERPKTELASDAVFSNDQMALGAIAGIYSRLISSSSYAAGGVQSITYISGLSADELIPARLPNEFFSNDLLSTSPGIGSLWSNLYKDIYGANSIIEYLSRSNGVTDSIKTQLVGEALFLRSFSYFYLTSLYGDVPLVTTTDYRINATILRTPVATVYQQIIKDLKTATEMLSSDYSYFKNERVRPTKWAALALLSRIYLVLEDWDSAESTTTIIIGNSNQFELTIPSLTFLKNSKESIWQLCKDDGNTWDAGTYFIPSNASSPTYASMSQRIVAAFDTAHDLRYKTWIGKRVTQAKTFFFSNKYRSIVVSPITEYTTVMRLSEQYLMRAEARLNLSRVIGANGAIADLNVIRRRAGLEPMVAGSLEEVRDSIEIERTRELFVEWGHRWLDLRRWPSQLTPGDSYLRRADDILEPIKESWNKEDKLYPIPQVQIDNNPAMSSQQNPGYN